MILAAAAANLERKLAEYERLANKRPTSEALGSQVGQFALSVGVGPAGGVIGTALLWLLLLRKPRLDKVLGTRAQLATVVAVAAGCDLLREDAGLVAAISWDSRWPISGALTSRPAAHFSKPSYSSLSASSLFPSRLP